MSYKFLPPEQLKGLLGAEPIVPAFSDSTHEVVKLKFAHETFILKSCVAPLQSSFWQAMERLFGLNLPCRLGGYSSVYDFCQSQSVFAIPDLIDCASQTDCAPGYLLTRWVEGGAFSAEEVGQAEVLALVDFWVAMHAHTRTSFGEFSQPGYEAFQWSSGLQRTLGLLAKQCCLDQALLSEALSVCPQLNVTQFCPIIPDLRWDQFLKCPNQSLALLDLDALVWGPRELDWVLLEYLLTAEQMAIFCQGYAKTLSIPDLSICRMPYRVLLFLMNVLGETDSSVWMSHPQSVDICLSGLV